MEKIYIKKKEINVKRNNWLILKAKCTSKEFKRSMKFLCHIRVCNDDLSRTTYLVTHDSLTHFYLVPIENLTLGVTAKFPEISLSYSDQKWRINAEKLQCHLSANISQQIIAQVSARIFSDSTFA